MKHPINRKVQLYYVCNNIEFKRVLVPLRKTKTSLFVGAQRHESSYAILWRLNRQKKRFVLVCPSIASYLGRNF